MLVKVFRKVYWYTPVLLLLLGGLLWISLFISPADAVPEALYGNPPLFNLLPQMQQQHVLLASIVAFALLFVQVLFINHIATSRGYTDRYSAIAAVLYLLLMSSTTTFLVLHPVLFANIFLIAATNSILRVYDSERAMREVFDAGYFIALAGIFYFPALAMFPVLLFSLYTYNIFNLRSLCASLIGLATPVLAFGLFYWITDMLALQIQAYYDMFVSMPFTVIVPVDFNKVYVVLYVVVLLFLVVWTKTSHMPGKLLRVRARMQVAVYFLLFSVFSFVLTPDHAGIHFAMTAAPLSLLMAVFLNQLQHKKVAELVFVLVVLLVVAGRL